MDRKRKRPAPPSYRLITADEIGLLKIVEVPDENDWKSSKIVQRWGKVGPDVVQPAVQRLATSTNNLITPTGVCCVAAARAGGHIELLSSADGHVLAKFPASGLDGSSPTGGFSGSNLYGSRAQHHQVSDVRMLQFLGGYGSSHGDSLRLVSCTEGGNVTIRRCEAEAAADFLAPPDASTGGPAAGANAWDSSGSFKTFEKVAAASLDLGGRRLAVGGDGHNLQVFDLETQKATFQGRGGKPSRSGLTDLAHVTALSFLPPTAAGPGGAGDAVTDGDCNKIAVGTAKHKLWLYDMRAGRRPQQEHVWGEARVTAITPEPAGDRCFVANGQGIVEAWDFRKGTVGGALRGAGGSVRSIALSRPWNEASLGSGSGCGPDRRPPLAASVGLDRYLHVYATAGTKRPCVGKVYLKQRLNDVAWLPTPLHGEDGEESEREEEKEDTPVCKRTAYRK